MLVFLVVLTLALRLVSAGFAHPIRSDGVYYIHVAKYLESGNNPAAFEYLGPNLYPFILLGIHKLGFDFETAGKAWGIVISTLTIFPLLGLARRQFGRPVSWVTGFLYAVHPRFIEWAPEVVRDPTFWFCSVTALYALQCFNDQRRFLDVFLAAGGTIAAIYTRSEGFLLFLPWLATAFKSWQLRRTRRLKPYLYGAMICLVPLTAIVANGVYMGHVFSPWGRIWQVAQNLSFGVTVASEPAKPERSQSVGRQAAYLGKKLFKGFGIVCGFPMLVGMYRLRRRLLRPEQLSQFVMGLAVVVLVMVYLARFGEINTRYFLMAVLLGSPYAAFGWIVIFNRGSHWVRDHFAWQFYKSVWAAGVCTLFVVFAGMSCYFVDRSQLMRDVSLGNEIRSRYGTGAFVAYWGQWPLVQYACDGRGEAMPSGRDEWSDKIVAWQPAVVIADMSKTTGPAFAEFLAVHPELCYQRVYEERFEGRIGRVLFGRTADSARGSAP